MSRAVKHDPDVMLDAVRELALAGGPAAVSARAVSLATGAPSGSIYHRFRRRDDLVAAAWLRAQDRFLAVYLGELDQRTVDAGAAAAAGVLCWSAANPQDAALLLRHSLDDLLRDGVSATLGERAASNQRRLQIAVAGYAAAIDRPLAEVTLAVVDLPYALTRRVLRESRSPTGAEVAAVRRAASLLLEREAS